MSAGARADGRETVDLGRRKDGPFWSTSRSAHRARRAAEAALVQGAAATSDGPRLPCSL